MNQSGSWDTRCINEQLRACINMFNYTNGFNVLLPLQKPKAWGSGAGLYPRPIGAEIPRYAHPYSWSRVGRVNNLAIGRLLVD